VTMVIKVLTAKKRSRVIGLATEGEQVLVRWPRTTVPANVTPVTLECTVKMW